MAKTAKVHEGKKLRLTAFLIKEDLKTIEDFVDSAKLKRIDIKTAGATGTLFYKGGFRNTPSWTAVFADVPSFDPSQMVNQSCRALYVCKEAERWFCFTFGYTRHLLREAAIERNFGLRVSLNLGDPEAIKAIDKTSISHLSLQSREQAGRDVRFDGFEFDTDIDLLKSMTAKSRVRDGEEQETYSGRDSITVYTRVDLRSFADIAKKLYRAYQSTAYKQRYPWIDKISQERDPTILKALDSQLVSDINAGNTSKIWMAIPEIISWEDVENFAYRVSSSSSDKKPGPVLHPDIDLDSWLTELKLSDHLSLAHLHNRKIYQYFKDGREPSGWSVYRCMNAEMDLEGQKYILNDSDWYAVDSKYVSQVDNFYKDIPTSALSLPQHNGKTEPTYLAAVVKTNPQFALMDRKNIAIGGGKSTVEFCDLFSNNQDIIHVKQYGGSSLLSHLFSQALVSAGCFLHEADFRSALNKLLPSGFKLSDPIAEPNPGHFTICIAIMSKVPGPLELPFFSKVSLRHAVNAMRRMNLKVTKLKIDF